MSKPTLGSINCSLVELVTAFQYSAKTADDLAMNTTSEHADNYLGLSVVISSLSDRLLSIVSQLEQHEMAEEDKPNS